jgi:hypothetical protein
MNARQITADVPNYKLVQTCLELLFAALVPLAIFSIQQQIFVPILTSVECIMVAVTIHFKIVQTLLALFSAENVFQDTFRVQTTTMFATMSTNVVLHMAVVIILYKTVSIQTDRIIVHLVQMVILTMKLRKHVKILMNVSLFLLRIVCAPT